MPGLTAQDLIRMLALKPHPEGGHFRETFRDEKQIADGRAASTATYFLLARGERAHWHRLDAAEIWHWYAGAATAAAGAPVNVTGEGLRQAAVDTEGHDATRA